MLFVCVLLACTLWACSRGVRWALRSQARVADGTPADGGLLHVVCCMAESSVATHPPPCVLAATQVGLDVQYDNQRRLCCDTEWKCTGQVRTDWGAGRAGRRACKARVAACWALCH